jgi:tight adherence protein B
LTEPWVIYALIFVAALLGVQALYWLAFRTRRTQKAINRRLALSQQLSSPVTVLETLRAERGFSDLANPILRNLSDQLTQSGLKLDKGVAAITVVLLIAIFFSIAGLAVGFGLAALALALAATVLTLFLFVESARRRRIARFAEQLPDAIDIIVRGVRIGHPFSSALGLVAREMPDPIGTEFGMAFDEISFGLDVRGAIENLYRRVGQEDLLFLVISINVQSQTGGNLAEILSRLSRLIRDRAKIRLKIRALTAEGRLSAIFLTLMPFVLFGIISLLSPAYFGDVRHHPLIVPAAVLGLTLLFIGNVIIYRMVNFKY